VANPEIPKRLVHTFQYRAAVPMRDF